MIRQIPNILTSINLLCGCVAVLFAASGDLILAAFFVMAGIIFDFFDGLAARWLNAQSDVGLELDSIADAVTSGVAPAVVMIQMINVAIHGEYLNLTESFHSGEWGTSFMNYLPLVGLLIAVGAAYRLAKFNVDDRQSERFIGLPTPANAILILSLPLILEFQHTDWIVSIVLNKWLLVGLSVLSVILMNAEISLFALKFKTWDFKRNAIRYVFLLVSLVVIYFLQFLALPVLILLYFLFSLFWKTD